MIIRHEQERELIASILKAAGASEEESRITADVLTEGDLRGFSSHGILRLPYIIRAIRRGTIVVPTRIKVEEKTDTVALVDGGHGLGHFVAYRAMQLAIDKAQKTGISAVGVKNSNHFGIAGYYAQMAIQREMIGIVMTTTDALVHPWGGAEAILGTNALAVGIPSNPPILLDMATSAAARGKILQALKEGKRIPEGWAIDEEGNPTTDPSKALRGALSPFGGAKGYGLGFVIGILAGPLVGAAAGKKVKGTLEPIEGYCTKGDLMLALNPKIFVDWEVFQSGVRDLIDQVKSCKPAKGFTRVMIPGEPEWECRERRLKEGILIPDEIWREIERLKTA